MKLQNLKVPSGIDSKMFNAFHKRAILELSNDAKDFHFSSAEKGKNLIQQASVAAKSMGISSKDSKILLQQHLKSKLHNHCVRSVKKEKILTGHNPARYAPYSFPWSSLNAGGIGGASLYDVNANTGSLGADLQDYFGGSGSAASAVGFWYRAQHTGNLFVNAQILVSGGAEVYAFPGYANANAYVKVFAQQWEPWISYSAQSVIYDRSAYVFSVDVDSNVYGLYSASITVPIIAGGWYALWGALYQHVTAGGVSSAVSNFRGYVGPITYIEV